MLHSLFIGNFNQEKFIKTDLDLQDLVILNYIWKANAEPKLEHITIENEEYVWLSHSKILDDIPGIKIGADRLEKRIKSLKDKGYINKRTISNQGASRGSKSYYRCLQATFDLMTTEENVSPVENNGCTPVENNGSNKELVYKELNTINISKDILTSKPKTKKFDYSECLTIIRGKYPNNKKLQDKLIEYLNYLLSIHTLSYTKQWITRLKKLDSLDGDKLAIVSQSLENDWKTFYPLSKNNAYQATTNKVKAGVAVGRLSGEKF